MQGVPSVSTRDGRVGDAHRSPTPRAPSAQGLGGQVCGREIHEGNGEWVADLVEESASDADEAAFEREEKSEI